jgi:hypothetical protein
LFVVVFVRLFVVKHTSKKKNFFTKICYFQHRPRSATKERIAVVDLFESDDESDSADNDEDEDDKAAEVNIVNILFVLVSKSNIYIQENEEMLDLSDKKGLCGAELLCFDPIPDVGKVGTNKAVALSKLRACRLLGNLFVLRVHRAQTRHENFFQVCK